MATRDYDLETRGFIPPYGPTKGTLQALQMLRRMTPSRIDSDFLRVSKIAPGNEYKVVGALRFMRLIDDDGRPTESSRLLKTKGPTYTLALQDIVRSAYSGVFRVLRPNEITRDGIYNYFVTEGSLGAEMATKATRFLLKLCRLAEIEIASDQHNAPLGSKRKPRSQQHSYRRLQSDLASQDHTRIAPSTFPLVVALTPEMAGMNVEQLADLFRKMRIAYEQSLAS
ncbi:MAG: DUF5343 domain-containing protein [Dehalococcoidia bacterium]